MKSRVSAMEKLEHGRLTHVMSATTHSRSVPAASPRPDHIARLIGRRSFCTLGTASASNHPHVAGVLYVSVGTVLFVSTRRTSRKARNIASNQRAFVCIPVRRLPLGPPASVQFAAMAEVLDVDHPDIVGLRDGGELKPITSHGELGLPDGCFLRIAPMGSVHTFGLGLPLGQLIRDPLHADGRVELVRS